MNLGIKKQPKGCFLLLVRWTAIGLVVGSPRAFGCFPTTVNRLPYNRLPALLMIAGNGTLPCFVVPAPAIRSTHGERLHGYTDNGCGEVGTRVPTTDYRLLWR